MTLLFTIVGLGSYFFRLWGCWTSAARVRQGFARVLVTPGREWSESNRCLFILSNVRSTHQEKRKGKKCRTEPLFFSVADEAVLNDIALYHSISNSTFRDKNLGKNSLFTTQKRVDFVWVTTQTVNEGVTIGSRCLTTHSVVLFGQGKQLIVGPHTLPPHLLLDLGFF